MRLNAKQKQQFETDGYLVVEDVLTPSTLAEVRSEYAALLDKLYDGWSAAGMLPDPQGLDFWQKLLTAYQAGCDWFQPMDISLPPESIQADTPMHVGPAVFDMLRDPGILDMVEDLIGPEITSNPIQHVRIKPPAKNLSSTEARAHITATDWHQDRAVAHAEADTTRMVTVWLAITDATPENGCLQVVPGKPDMLPHCPSTQLSIAEGYCDRNTAIPLPVRAGGAVLFHPLTPHSSLTNTTSQFRWSFDLRYNVTGDSTGRSHFPEFVARSPAQPGTVLDDWREWRDLWQVARRDLSDKEHISFHRWSSESPACA